LAALFDGKSLQYFHQSQESEIYIHSIRSDYEAKYYDLEVHYHPGKANVVADALSRMHCNYVTLESYNQTSCEEIRKLNLELVEHANLYAI
jgi:hypothetical protein